MSELLIFPRTPYNFKLSLDFMLLKGDNNPLPERRVDNRLLRAFRIGDRIIPTIISFTGNIDKPILIVSTYKNLSSKEKDDIKGKIIYWLNLDDDLSEIYRFMEKDEKLKKIKERLYGFKPPKIGVTIYEAIIKSIIQQQISLIAAFRIISNFVKVFGDYVTFEKEKIYDFPTPDRFANTSVSKLRKYGLSRRKAEYIIDFSKKVVNGEFNLDEISDWDEKRIVSELKKFRGIGMWTAKLVAIAGLGIGQAPAEDLGIRKAISKYYFNGKLQTVETIKEFMERWRGLKYLPVYLLYAYRIGLEI